MIIWNFYAFRVEGFFDGFPDFKAGIPVFVGERPDSSDNADGAAVKIVHKHKGIFGLGKRCASVSYF